jgi:hypothetical protein
MNVVEFTFAAGAIQLMNDLLEIASILTESRAEFLGSTGFRTFGISDIRGARS